MGLEGKESCWLLYSERKQVSSMMITIYVERGMNSIWTSLNSSIPPKSAGNSIQNSGWSKISYPIWTIKEWKIHDSMQTHTLQTCLPFTSLLSLSQSRKLLWIIKLPFLLLFSHPSQLRLLLTSEISLHQRTPASTLKNAPANLTSTPAQHHTNCFHFSLEESLGFPDCLHTYSESARHSPSQIKTIH